MKLIDIINDKLNHTDQRLIIGITGPMGSGKGILARELIEQLNRDNPGTAVLLSAENYALSPDIIKEMDAPADDVRSPEFYDVDGYVSMLTRLRDADRDVFIPSLDVRPMTSLTVGARVAPDVRVIITEGDYLGADEYGWGQVRDLLDNLYFLETDFERIKNRMMGYHLGNYMSRSRAESLFWDFNVKSIYYSLDTKNNADNIIHL